MTLSTSYAIIRTQGKENPKNQKGQKNMKTIETLKKEIYWMALIDWMEEKLYEVFKNNGWKKETEERMEKAFRMIAEDTNTDYKELMEYYYE